MDYSFDSSKIFIIVRNCLKSCGQAYGLLPQEAFELEKSEMYNAY